MWFCAFYLVKLNNSFSFTQAQNNFAKEQSVWDYNLQEHDSADSRHTMLLAVLSFCNLLHTNKCTNCISYISLKLFSLEQLKCSYMFR